MKAVEKSVIDSSWWRAQRLELIEAEGATMLDKDEEAMIQRETDLERRLEGRSSWQKDFHQPSGHKGWNAGWSAQGGEGKGKSEKATPKGKKGKDKGAGKGFW